MTANKPLFEIEEAEPPVKTGPVMSCDCIERTDEKLKRFNAMVDTATVVNMETGDFLWEPVRLNVVKLDDSRPYAKPGKPWITAHFCPMCGVRYSINPAVTPESETAE